MIKNRKRSKRVEMSATINSDKIANIERFLFLEATKQRITDKLRTVNWRTRLEAEA